MISLGMIIYIKDTVRFMKQSSKLVAFVGRDRAIDSERNMDSELPRYGVGNSREILTRDT